MKSENPTLSTKPILGNYYTCEQLACELGKTVRTLNRWHALRIGPPRVKAGKTPLYPVDGVLEWLASQTQAA